MGLAEFLQATRFIQEMKTRLQQRNMYLFNNKRENKTKQSPKYGEIKEVNM